jgi:hypothetical protein
VVQKTEVTVHYFVKVPHVTVVWQHNQNLELCLTLSRCTVVLRQLAGDLVHVIVFCVFFVLMDRRSLSKLPKIPRMSSHCPYIILSNGVASFTCPFTGDVCCTPKADSHIPCCSPAVLKSDSHITCCSHAVPLPRPGHDLATTLPFSCYLLLAIVLY